MAGVIIDQTTARLANLSVIESAKVDMTADSDFVISGIPVPVKGLSVMSEANGVPGTATVDETAGTLTVSFGANITDTVYVTIMGLNTR